jgi:hypothetical protein
MCAARPTSPVAAGNVLVCHHEPPPNEKGVRRLKAGGGNADGFDVATPSGGSALKRFARVPAW